MASTTTCLPPGKLHHKIRTQPARLGGHGFLLGKIAVRKHAGDLDHAPQLNLSPASAHVRSAQRPHQIAGLRLQLFLRRDQRLHLGVQIAVGFAARHFHLLNLCIHFIQRIAHRRNHVGDSFLPRSRDRRWPRSESASGVSLAITRNDELLLFNASEAMALKALRNSSLARVTSSIFSLLVFRSDSSADSSLALRGYHVRVSLLKPRQIGLFGR